MRTHAAPANRRLRENEGLPNQPFNNLDIYIPSTDMAAVDNNNDDQAPSLVRVRCFHQPRPAPQQGGGMDFFLEITGDNVSKIIGSTRHLWTLTAAGAAIAPVWKVLCIFARRLSLPTEAEAEVQNLLDASTLFQVVLKDETWERLFSEYVRSGLFDASYASDKLVIVSHRSSSFHEHSDPRSFDFDCCRSQDHRPAAQRPTSGWPPGAWTRCGGRLRSSTDGSCRIAVHRKM